MYMPAELLDDDIVDIDDEMEAQWEEMREEAHKWAVNRERKFLEDWCAEAGLKEPVAYSYEYYKGFTIYTNRPGILIGKAGSLVNKYRDRLKEEFGKNNKIKFVEIKNGFVNY